MRAFCLVDADLRRPSIHKVFNIKPKVGLSTLLTGSSKVGEYHHACAPIAEPLSIPAGPPPPHPAELLGSAIMKQYIAQWREQYDHMIFDTPPAFSVTDSILLSVDMDSVILVIRSGNTTKAALATYPRVADPGKCQCARPGGERSGREFIRTTTTITITDRNTADTVATLRKQEEA